MARRLRIQFKGAAYHVLNRGNYRQDVFETADKAAAFSRVLFETCERMGWRLYAHVLMRNHYHLAIETPEPNLVEGMHWLQTTFATRFNGYRHESGHVFQGRYRALLVEPGAALLRLVNYIHLNPVRAGIVPIEQVASFRWGSLRWLKTGDRPAFYCPEEWLALAGLTGDREGSEAYVETLRLSALTSLNEDVSAEFTTGWAIGTPSWRRAIADEHRQTALCPSIPANEIRELKEAQWIEVLAELLRTKGKILADAAGEPKGAGWKVEVASAMRDKTTASNRWLAEKLAMGKPGSVSHYLSELKRRSRTIQRLET